MDSKSTPGSPLRSASALLFCRMCQAVYRQPKLLPCLHSFCKPCLVDVVTYAADGTAIVCPLCSHKTKLPPDGVAAIPDNCFLSRMCQEYISEVQSHIVARSLYPTASKRSSEFTELRSKLTEELSQSTHSRAQSPVPQQNSSNLLQKESQQASTPEPDSSSGQPTAKALKAIHNMGRLQAKIMNLQGEALRVTYAIDHVNQCMVEWHQHKGDLKMAVQRRASQFQFFIKRMEHQMMTQIDSKHVDDEFYTESDKSKTELRKVLKKILHEVSVLKNIQELGNDDEINTLSSDLLGKSVGMTEVLLKKLHYDMDVSTQSIEEIVADWFGEVRLNPVAVNVFSPEALDFTEIPVGNSTEQNGQGISPYEEDTEKCIVDGEELDPSVAQKISSRSFSDSSCVRYNDEDLDKEDVREHLVQFQNVRETLRTRRREILAQGQQAREGVSPLRDESRRRPRSAMRKGRVQSLDRIATSVPKRSSKIGPINGSNTAESSTENRGKSQNESASAIHPELAFNLLYMTGDSHYLHRSIPEDIHVPSPVIEEVSLLHAPQRILVKQTSDPRSILSSLEEVSGSEAAALPSHSQSSIEHLSTSARSDDMFRGRRHSSDQYALTSSEKGPQLDLAQDRNSTRLVRRAMSSVADRKAKIDFLRENWQKRKEILIQNEGFVSPDSFVKHATRPSTDRSHQTVEDITSDNKNLTKQEELCKENGEADSSLSSRRYISDFQTMSHMKDSKPEAISQIPVTSHYSVIPVSPTMAAKIPRTMFQPIIAATSTQTSTLSSATQQLPVSLAQETAAPTIPNTQTIATTSRYSRLQTRPTETKDVPSLITSMYSGTITTTTPTPTTQVITGAVDTNTTIGSNTRGGDSTDVSADTSWKLAATMASHSSRPQTENQSYKTTTGSVVQEGILQSQQPKQYPYAIPSRYNEGIIKRRTINDEQENVKISTTDKPLFAYIPHGISALTSFQSRSVDHLKNLGSSEDNDTALLPHVESTDSEMIKYANIGYKTRGDTTRRMSSPLHLMQEKILSDQSATSDSSAASTTSPQPPPSPTASDGIQKVRLRELARKKKERWRHLTIH